MAMSGIEIDDEVTTVFNEVKLRHAHKYALFKIEAKKMIKVDYVADPATTDNKKDDKTHFMDMKSRLPRKIPRYILYDFGFTNKEGRNIQKIAFIFWCDDDSKVGDKMIYASSKDTIKKAFTGLSLEFQANDDGDMDYDTFCDEVEKKA